MSSANGPRGSSRNEDEKRRIIVSLFSNRNKENGRLVEDYITHARIGEVPSISELQTPTMPPKERVVIVSVLADGAVRVHKARENDNGTFQIGRTWGMQELITLENPGDDVAGIVAHFGKPYFWSLSSFGAKQRFVQSISQVYEKFTGQPLRLQGLQTQSSAPSSRGGASNPAPKNVAHPQPQPQRSRQSLNSETAPLRPVDPLVPNRRSQPHADLRQPPPMSPKRNSAGATRQSFGALAAQSVYQRTPNLSSASREKLSGSPAARFGSPALAARSSQASLGSQSQKSLTSQQTQDPVGHSSDSSLVTAPYSPALPPETVSAVPAAENSPSIPPPSDLRSFKSMRRVPSEKQPSVPLLSPSQMPPSTTPNQTLPLAPKSQSSSSLVAPKPQSTTNLDSPAWVSEKVSPRSSPRPPSAGGVTPGSLNAMPSGSVPAMPPVPERIPRSPERRRTFGSIPGTPRSRGSGLLSSPFYDAQRVWQKSHSRHASATSQQSLNDIDRRQAFLDLETTLNELQWDGSLSVEEVEKEVNRRLQELGETNTANVVSLNDRLDELEKLADTSIDDSQMLQQLIGFFVVQLSGIGDEVSKIGGRGNEPQVVAMNQRNLYHELEHLLEMVSLPPEVIEIVSRSNLGSLRDLERLEPALVELHRAVQTLEFGGDQGVGSMRLLQEQKGATLQLAADFGERVEKYLVDEFHQMAAASHAGDTPIRLDVPFLAKTYPLASLVLFMKESDPARYQSLLSHYTSTAGRCYSDSFSTFAVRWKRQAEQAVGSRPVFTLQDKHDSSLSGNNTSSTAAAALAKRTKSLRQPSQPRPLSSGSTRNPLALESNNLAALERLFDQLVEVVTLHVSAQQQLLVRFFHLSSHGGRRFDLYIRQVPVELRTEQAEQFSGTPEVGEVDTSRQESANTRKQVSLVFSKMDELLTIAGNFIGQSTLLESVYLIAKLEIKLDILQSKDQEFVVESLNKLHSRLTQKWSSCIDDQVRAILGSHVTKKRHGFLSIVARFTQYVLVVEQALKDVGADIDKLPVRKLVDQSHEQLYRAFLQIFQTSAASENSGLEDKELLNHHVTMISNLNGVITKLDTVSSFSIQSILLQAKQTYKTELEAYIKDILHRPIGRIIDFVNQAQSPKFKNIKQKNQVLALKKALVGFDGKEVRKSTDTLKKRVEKHFYMPDEGAGDPALFKKVWSAISAQYLDYYNQVSEWARKLDAENAVEFSRQDIVTAFS